MFINVKKLKGSHFDGVYLFKSSRMFSRQQFSINGGYGQASNGNIKNLPARNENNVQRAYPEHYRASTSKREVQNGHQKPNNDATSTNNLGLLGMPKSNRFSQKAVPSDNRNANWSQNVESRLKTKNFGETEQEKVCILTGTVERVIKYGKIFQNHFCYFQVIGMLFFLKGSVVSIADGKVQFEKAMLLRDKKGPILQLIYYSNATHINIDDFHLGQNLRAVGRMVGPNVMSALTIRAATQEEMDILPRLCYVSDYAVSTLCGDKPAQLKA